MNLRAQFQAANLKMDVTRTIADSLRELAGVNGPVTELEMLFIANLVSEDVSVLPAPFDELWPFGKLFLSSCICLAVLDGDYSIEKARKISEFAHKLGLSAYQLADLEKTVIGELKASGTGLPDIRTVAHAKSPKSSEIAVPPARFLTEDVSALWNSDSELITRTDLGIQKIRKPERND